MNILILGPQGSGKGTQAKLIAHWLNFRHISTGEMLRDMAKSDASLRALLDQGLLVDNDLLLHNLFSYLEKNGFYDRLIIDGSPRTVCQYHGIIDWFKAKGHPIALGIYLDISDEEALRRLAARRQHKITGEIYNLVTNPPGPEVKDTDLIQRDDDMPEAIQKRLELFHTRTDPIVKLMEADGILFKVNGERPIEEIFADLKKEVEKIVHNDA